MLRSKGSKSRMGSPSPTHETPPPPYKVQEKIELKPKDIRPLKELPGFPMDIVQVKNRNRKLLAALNKKKRFRDFEYKNYDSTDSDLYEEEDYMKITNTMINSENDYLRKRRLQRRFNVKNEIIEKQRRDKALALQKRQRRAGNFYASAAPVERKALKLRDDRGGKRVKTPKNSKQLNEVFAQCLVPTI